MKTVSYFFSVLFFSLLILNGCKKDPLIPLVTTSEVSDITLTSAMTGGNVTEDGGEAVTERGICWGTTENPTTSGNATINGTGTGSFESNLEGLVPGTTYYVRAYAINSVGTAYGEQVAFNTTPVTVPILATSAVTEITLTTAKSGGNISSDGGGAVTARGICWGTTVNPTTSGNVTLNGTGTGSFVSNLEGLTPGTIYFIRSYATNSAGTAYGNQLTFTTAPIIIPTVTTTAVTGMTINAAVSGGNVTSNGGGEVTARGVVWSASVNPTTDNSSTSNGTGSGAFVSNLAGLTPATTYYVRAYATNSAGTAYGNELTFTTLVILVPTVTTASITNVTPSTAVSGGNVTNNGGANVTARGIVWSIATNPSITDHVITNGSGMGSFISNISGLTEGTTYYVRAYATNSAGTGYGTQLTFKTTMTPLTDSDGNVYQVVKIGNQVWMAENLRTTKYNEDDGTLPIPNVTDPADWGALTTPAYVWYNNNITNKDTYGAIYNWYTVATGNLCPTGWHEPTEAEYGTLEASLGMSAAEIALFNSRGTDQGTQLKATTTWTGGNGTNSSGFKALAGGYLQWASGTFAGLGVNTYFWTATDDSPNGNTTVAYYRRLDASESGVYRATTEKRGGKYVRCVKD